MTLYTNNLDVMPAAPTPKGGPEERVAEYASKYRSPCEVFSCDNSRRCAEQQLACRSFARFVAKTYRKGVNPPTAPSREIFDEIYGEDDDE